jgi:protein-S-isoprenylcysteine O-methyltransferase Ste14
MSDVHTRSFPDVLRDLASQLTTLLRKEAELARTEVSEKISQATGGLVFLLAGAVLLIPALVVLLSAAVAVLVERGMAPPWAALLVGCLALLAGIVLLVLGMYRLKARNLVPQKTIDQLQQDASTAKQQMRPHHEIKSAA